MSKFALSLTFCLFFFAGRGQDIPHNNCDNCWNADSLGNHRAILHFQKNGSYAKAIVPWRRRDHHPENKIIIQDAATGLPVQNIKTGMINREYGEIYFEPVSGAGTYYLYYLPYKSQGRSNYPNNTYLKADYSPQAKWINNFPANKGIPEAIVQSFESVDSFNTFYPMEVIATGKETEDLLAQHSGDKFLVFPEDGLHSIRMKTDLPLRWIKKGPRDHFTTEADRGENLSYQLGVYALKDLHGIKVSFSDLTTSSGQKIPAAKMSCINTGGIDYTGKAFSKNLDIKDHTVQPLWCYIEIPEDATPGTYHGSVSLKSKNATSKEIKYQLTITNHVVKEGNAIQPWKMTRLPWLNSTMAQENTVIAPYTALKVTGNTISLLGRKVTINKDGLPTQITTYFSPTMTEYTKKGHLLLTNPMTFGIKDAGGKLITLKSTGLDFIQKTPGTVSWQAISQNDDLKMEVNASLEFDGFTAYTVRIIAKNTISLSDISLEIPFQKDFAKYMMGLGQKGGYRPASFDWKWDVAHKNQDGSWIGNVNGGLQFSLRDQHYSRPLNTNFYLLKPLLLPTSWGNHKKGGIHIRENGKTVSVLGYSGARTMQAGDTLFYNFTLLITPFHTLNTDFQWATRFFHAYKPIPYVKATGATIINIHHATAINPWINYPFIAWPAMKAYIDSAHKVGLQVKIYNTIRELSNHAYETFAIRSLGHEIYSSGKGGGFSWLQEHLDSDYIAAWFVPQIKDAAIINSGMNRWHNYYVEGMNWLTQHVGIDGIYLDDVAFDRVTMKRIKRVLTEDGHPGIIDLHSANQYNKSDGFNNSANLYMEHFPYLNRLWFGEYFDYEHNQPDFFLTEVSGIPFGLMGEMLQGGGNPWRGMIYGMTNRMPWSDNADPRPIWKAWDDFGMQGTQMIGYWVEDSPVKTSNLNVLATVYQKKNKVMVSLASWAKEDTTIQLKVDWGKLGIDLKKVSIHAPFIKNFQPERDFKVGENIPVEKAKGWLLILSEK